MFPSYDTTTNDLYWIITGNHSSLINASYINQIQMYWQSADPVINNYIQNAQNKYDLKIPAAALRDEMSYRLYLNVSNQARTFIEQANITFVPISCKYYIVNGSDAYSYYNNYTFSQASSDISFNLVYNQLQSYCNSAMFFNTL